MVAGPFLNDTRAKAGPNVCANHSGASVSRYDHLAPNRLSGFVHFQRRFLPLIKYWFRSRDAMRLGSYFDVSEEILILLRAIYLQCAMVIVTCKVD
jgi:hypothetical protein